MRFFNFAILFVWALGLGVYCTNPSLRELDDRVRDNFAKDILIPGDLDPAGTDQFSFIVVGDTHVGNDAGKVLPNVITAAQQGGDAFIVVAGDITDSGGKGQLEDFVNYFTSTSMPYRAAIGNHDIYFNGWSHYKSYVGASIYSFDADNVHFVMLDTANGVLGERQLSWLEDDLGRNTKPHTVVVSHFPPWVGNFSSMFKMASEEEAAIFKDILYRHSVDLMFSGHYHGYEKVTLGRTTYVVTGGANTILDPGNRKHFIRVRVTPTSITPEFVAL